MWHRDRRNSQSELIAHLYCLAFRDLLITDFEENNLGKMHQWGWRVEGQAFRHDVNSVIPGLSGRAGPACGTWPVWP